MGVEMVLVPILMIFYLYLLVRWQHVKRPWCYLMGAAGLVVVMIAQFFALGNVTALLVIKTILVTLGTIAAFNGAVGACFGGKLPVWEAKAPAQGAGGQAAPPPKP
jgi:hypothetical protein